LELAVDFVCIIKEQIHVDADPDNIFLPKFNKKLAHFSMSTISSLFASCQTFRLILHFTPVFLVSLVIVGKIN
jgi:hypothetical protein